MKYNGIITTLYMVWTLYLTESPQYMYSIRIRWAIVIVEYCDICTLQWLTCQCLKHWWTQHSHYVWSSCISHHWGNVIDAYIQNTINSSYHKLLIIPVTKSNHFLYLLPWQHHPNWITWISNKKHFHLTTLRGITWPQLTTVWYVNLISSFSQCVLQ